MFVLRPWKGVEEKLPVIAKEAERLYVNYNLTPVFLALEPGRDLDINKCAAELVNCPHHVLAAPHDGHMIVGLMGKMELVVSMRLHALIFAAGLGIPLVGLVYDPKVSGFLDYLGKNRYVNLDALNPDILSAMNEEALAEGISAYSAQSLRKLAEENETAARRLLEEL
jgi:polysaccharide pyruvyl transferase WcaK-like protein